MKRTRRVHFEEPLDSAAAIHLSVGCCLMAGGCSACTDEDEAERWALRTDHARALWERHREEILAIWERTLEHHGAPSFPTFAECIFEGAALPTPKRSAQWSERALDLLAQVVAAVDEHRARTR